MTQLKNFLRTLWKDESAQGTAEYVLLIAIVVGIVIIFKDKIKSVMDKKISEVSDGISGVGIQ